MKGKAGPAAVQDGGASVRGWEAGLEPPCWPWGQCPFLATTHLRGSPTQPALCWPERHVHTHWSASEYFCRKATAAGALHVMYLWVNCTNLLMKGARWREDFL